MSWFFFVSGGFVSGFFVFGGFVCTPWESVGWENVGARHIRVFYKVADVGNLLDEIDNELLFFSCEDYNICEYLPKLKLLTNAKEKKYVYATFTLTNTVPYWLVMLLKISHIPY